METNGQLSVVPKTELQPVSRKDMNINVTQEELPVIFVAEGRILHKSLASANKDEKWLMKELEKNKIHSVENIFIAGLNSKKQLFYQLFNSAV